VEHGAELRLRHSSTCPSSEFRTYGLHRVRIVDHLRFDSVCEPLPPPATERVRSRPTLMVSWQPDFDIICLAERDHECSTQEFAIACVMPLVV